MPFSRFFRRPPPGARTTPLWRSFGSRFFYSTTGIVQFICAIHLINEHMFEVRNSTGASMLPTLAMEGDFLFQLRLPFASLLDSVRSKLSFNTIDSNDSSAHPYRSPGRIGNLGFSKSDPAQGTGLKVGDLVVALSPFNPSRTVCKRVLGLPGDTVCLDPRMRPLPMEAWRGRTAIPNPGTQPKEESLDSRMVKFEDLLASLGEPSSRRRTSRVDEEIDLLKSMDTHDSPTEPDTEEHNSAAVMDLQQNTYVRSKGDVQYVTVPLGHVWLTGDNLANSTDSRHYGPVPLGMVKGKVIARVYPSPRWLTSNLSFVD